jgi:tyrosyl-tRNA synthetase
LFGNATSEALKKLDEETMLAVFEGVPQFKISLSLLKEGVKAIELLTDHAAVFPSKGEMRKMVQSGGVNINKEKLDNQDDVLNESHLLNGKYLLAQKGKKNYFLLIAE